MGGALDNENKYLVCGVERFFNYLDLTLNHFVDLTLNLTEDQFVLKTNELDNND